MLIGTRVGLFGFILVLLVYIASEIFVAIMKKIKLNRHILYATVVGIAIVGIIIGIVGSSTLERRKHLKEIEGNIVDKGEEAHISGSLLKIKEKINKGEITEEELLKPAQQSILDLYNYANEHDVTNNDMRRQQLIYNICLVKNQANPILMLFGNGYMINYRELVFEMELIAFLLNFGLIGFTLYFGPFFIIFCYGIYIGVKNRKQITSEYLMLLGGIFCSFALSCLSGYTFFNSSSMMVIIVLCTCLVQETNKLKEAR